MSKLAADGVSMAFDGEQVFTDISLGVDAGEVLTVVGPSGAGKTTLLRLLAGFQPPDEGTVAWEGTDLWSLSEEERLARRRCLSVVFQEPCLFNAPVRRNVTYGLRIRRSWPERLRTQLQAIVGDPPAEETVERALDAVGLADKAEQNALSLSGGEAQRVAFARALATDPDVLLLDEPTSNLDPRNTAVLETVIDRARQRGVGVVVATHDMHQAERLSDRVAFAFEGELVETGPAERIFEDPHDARTRRFVAGELMYDGDEAADGDATDGEASDRRPLEL
jgi:tungstate transport system ATP-binding protein